MNLPSSRTRDPAFQINPLLRYVSNAICGNSAFLYPYMYAACGHRYCVPVHLCIS